jgi:hypothetical protein
MNEEREPLDEVLPPARQWAREEWEWRSWYGRAHIPFEVLLIPLLRGSSKIARRWPDVYREDSDE